MPTLFAQRSPNAEFREKALTLALAAVGAAAIVLRGVAAILRVCGALSGEERQRGKGS